ncbi:phosphotransferase [Rudaeicoccus suwonensis]|uniref:Phosphotransferase family enzyme n=1 Tax=Rudaeicoccus suwonensis TaxID=657409 RepID=A0A561EBG3_9MICO|nr:phosphotransferase [Rudaeicoccus suwonensis]TWE12950.1 phosphotransferase family enzyme [Rudaeicoccus suwonensis]
MRDPAVVGDGGSASALWSSVRWRQAATRWIDESLERRGLTRIPVTPRQPRVRPWSTQLVVDTSAGRAWFKAALPTSPPESAIYAALSAVAPDLLPPVWAADEERRWLLMPDQGPQLRDVADTESITGLWSSVLRSYSRLQRASVAVVDQVTRAGVPAAWPHQLVDRWFAGRGAGHTDLEPVLRDAADRLDSLGLPLTIEHGDLHAGNVFCADNTAKAAHDARFFDWGDAYVGNPLCSLLIALRGPSYHFGLPPDPERDARLFRAYAAGWADVVPASSLLAALDDAMLIARLARVFAMEAALVSATPYEVTTWAPRVVDPTVDEVVEVALRRAGRIGDSGISRADR